MSASACAWPVNSCRHAGLGQPLLPGARLDRLEGQTALPELVSCLLSTALPRGGDALQHDLGHGGGINWLADEISKRAGAEQRLNHGSGVMWA